jgi:MFS family permease
MVDRAKVGLSWTFVISGFLFATLASRFPDLRHELSLSNSAFGLILLCGSLGSMVAIPAAGPFIVRTSPAFVVRFGTALVAGGVLAAGAGVTLWTSVAVAGSGLFVFGIGFSLWDVAMNVEAAHVERRLGRTVMPKFHGAWSGGTVTGAALGIGFVALGVPMLLHLSLLVLPGLVLAVWLGGSYLPVSRSKEDRPSTARAWAEPRTLLLGLMVLCFGMAEGIANDWIPLALIDGFSASHATGVTGYFVFVVSMTVGRVGGGWVLDRFGRLPVMLACAALVAGAVALTVLSPWLWLSFVGIMLWGLGAALGFPVGISAAGEDPVRGAARVAVVSTVAYASFLAGPPLMGVLADRFGTLDGLLLVGAMMVPAALIALTLRRRTPSAP